jgi:hypothetical protein
MIVFVILSVGSAEPELRGVCTRDGKQALTNDS